MAAIYKRGKKGIWWIKYYVAGKPVYYSLRTTNRRCTRGLRCLRLRGAAPKVGLRLEFAG